MCCKKDANKSQKYVNKTNLFTGGYKYSLSIEPEIQLSSITASNNQLDIEECRDDLGDLEQVTQKGGSEKTESFFTKYVGKLIENVGSQSLGTLIYFIEGRSPSRHK